MVNEKSPKQDITDIDIPSDSSILGMSANFVKSFDDPNPESLELGFIQGASAMRTHFEREIARLAEEVDKTDTAPSLSPIQKLLMDKDFATVFALNTIKGFVAINNINNKAKVEFHEKLKRIFSKKR